MKRLLILPLLLLAAAPAPQRVSFTACPIARDTGPDTDMCFFTEHQGVRYGLSNPVDFGAPQLKHPVLVEGHVVPGEMLCGGQRIEGRVSVMPEIDTACDQIVPASAEVPPPPPNPATQRRIEEILARLDAEPALSLRPLRANNPPFPVIAGSAGTQHIHFPFESDRASGPDAMWLVSLAKLPGARIRLKATRGASRLDDGSLLAERAGMAQQRAEKMAGILRGLGVPADALQVQSDEKLPTRVAQQGWQSRRAEISWEIEKGN